MAAYFDIRGTATKILTASIATLTITTLLAIAYGVKVAGNLIPSTDDAYTVGTSTGPFRWSEGHFSDDILVGGSSVCLESGVNCPASSGSSTDTLAIVTARGASATSTLQLYGGFLASSSTVTSTFYVVGGTTLTNATTTGLFATSFKATSGTLTTLAGTNLFGETVSLGNVTSVSLFSASLKATSGTVTTLAGSTLYGGTSVFENATATSLFSTSLKATSGTVTTLAGTSLYGGVSVFADATSTSLFASSAKFTSSTITTLAAGTFFYGNATGTNLFATVVSSTNLFATTAIFATTTVAGKGVCLSDGSFCAAAAPGGLSGGIADSVAVWGSASTLGATSTFTYSTSTGALLLVGGYVSASKQYITNSLVIEDTVATSGIGWLTVGTSTLSSTNAVTFSTTTNYGQLRLINPNKLLSESGIRFQNGNTGFADSDGSQIGAFIDSIFYIKNLENGSIRFMTNGSEKWDIGATGHLVPSSNNVSAVGSLSSAISNLYVSSTAFFGSSLLPRIGAIPDIGSTTSAWGTVYFTSATGSLANLFNLNVSGTVDVASGTKMTYGGNNVRKTIVLTARGATVPFSNAAATATQTEGSTNRVNHFASSFQPSAWNTLQWTDIKAPNDYDGGTFDCKFSVTATSTPTFTGVTWTIRGVAIGSGDAIDTAWGATATKTIVNSFAANTELITSSTVMTMGNTPTRAKSWYFEASRDVANASDTNTTTQRLKEVVCTYGVDKWSSAF